MEVSRIHEDVSDAVDDSDIITCTLQLNVMVQTLSHFLKLKNNFCISLTLSVLASTAFTPLHSKPSSVQPSPTHTISIPALHSQLGLQSPALFSLVTHITCQSQHCIRDSAFKAQLRSAMSHNNPSTAFITLSSKPGSVQLSPTTIPALHS